MASQQNIVGPAIREMREKAGMTQAQLVAKLNILGWDLSRGTLAKIEAQVRCVADYEIVYLIKALNTGFPDLFRSISAENKHPGPRRS